MQDGISMLEMPVAVLMRRGWSRNLATSMSAIACWLDHLTSNNAAAWRICTRAVRMTLFPLWT
jgi:hypothetical protein